jgi:bifunctional non-homologous end joining protein LigD
MAYGWIKAHSMAVKKNTTAYAGKKSPLPAKLSPMLATLTDEPFDKPGWVFEVKWDGYRAVAALDGKKVELLSRNAKSFNEKFYVVHDALKALNIRAVLDGEIVVLGENGQADFGALQNWRSEADGSLIYFVFDIIWYEGKDLQDLPLTERRKILEKVLKTSDKIRLSEIFETSGTEFFKVAQKMNLEGIMAKKADSLYEMGNRSRDWLKIKTSARQEVVIGGYTKNDGTAKPFSSLLVGVYEKGKLHYTGKIGTGFNISQQKKMLSTFSKHIRKTNPFDELPDINKPSRFRPNPPDATATWLDPVLVCEVSYRELTRDGIMRHPSFEGMRDDKSAKQVKLEKPEHVESSTKSAKSKNHPSSAKLEKKIVQETRTGQPVDLLNPHEESQVKKISGHQIKFSNLTKKFWPKEGFTKRDLVNYYHKIADYILPYLKDRPQSLNRFPNGILGKSFYQKDVTGKVPDWMKLTPYESDKNKHFLVANDEASLLYMAAMGCIEMNPWSSTIKKPDNPSWCIIDLDPDQTTFNQVIEAANVTHQLLEHAGVINFCKTSGSTGLHIYIPLAEKYSYEQSKEFGRVIAKLVHEQLPKTTSIERQIKNRDKKMYIDFLQNRPQATLAAAYSLRPKPGAPVSMPLDWEEVKPGLKIADFNIQNAVQRVLERGDIFKPVLGKGINMRQALKKLSDLLDNNVE